MLRHLFAAASTALFLSTVVAQSQDGSMERIVAVVGKEIILQSDVAGQLEVLAQRNPSMNRNDPAMRSMVLDMLINERLVMSKAMEDSIEVTEEEITQQMDMRLQMLIQQFGSEQRLESLYGMSLARIRREFREEIRKQLLATKIREEKFRNVKAGRADVEEFYQRYRDSLPVVPTKLDLYHIVKYVKASDTQKKEALDLALRIRDSVVNGGSFADFARRYSADAASAVNGGDLGFAERGKFVPAFESAAFALQPGEVSQPVESPFGYHVIQLIEKRPSSVNTRHILIRVGQSESDKDKARAELLALKRRIEAGEDFETLAREHSDEKASAGFGGAMGQVEIGRLPDDLKTMLTTLPDKGMTDPMPYTADPTNPGFHIMYRKVLLPEHPPTVKEDYKLLEQMATIEKRQRMEQQWIEELRRTMYWEVR
ncbi:MAG: peptidylprolyl isomerase [Candidatus Kapabacteria bacterium]|nr:peptidylprolyl isomerase [Candidatus Kapabacteria bacterium]